MRFAEAAALRKRGIAEVVGFDAQRTRATRSAKRPACERPFTFSGAVAAQARQSVSSVQVALASRKRYSGKFLVRLSPALHKKAALKAMGGEISLIEFVADAIAQA